ncbi:MAG: SPOR domain-containing protein, partial [Gammaproteobacteria bacterium]
LPMVLDGSGVRKTRLEVVIPAQPLIESQPEFEQKIVELRARVEELPALQPQFVDEKSSPGENLIEREQVQTPEPAQASDDLPGKPTKTEAQLSTVTSKPGGDTWVLQVGSFKDRSKALSQRDKLRKSNIAAVFIELFKNNNQSSYRVRLGPFPSREKSKIAQNKIKAKHNIDGLIMRYEK